MLTNSPVEEGDDLVVTVEVSNSGRRKGEQEVCLYDYDDNLVDSRNVQLHPREKKEVSLVWATEPGDEGRGEVRVECEDDDKSTFVEINIGFW